MKISIISNMPFAVTNIGYRSDGEVEIRIESAGGSTSSIYPYTIDLGSGQSSARPILTILQHTETYLGKKNLREKTVLTYRHMSQHLAAYGDCRLDNVTTEYLQGFVRHLSDSSLKTSTQRLLFQKLCSVLHDADREGLFDIRILNRVNRARKETDKKEFLTDTELRRMANISLPAESANVRNMFLFSCMTGLRFGDVQRLRWENVKTHNRHLRLEFVQQKTRTSETLPLCAEAEDLLRRLRSVHPNKAGSVFLHATNQYANKILRRWQTAARIRKHVTFHTGRHTFCVRLLSHNVPIYTVQQLMCHADIRTTQIYADLMDSSKKKAVNKISGLPILVSAKEKRA